MRKTDYFWYAYVIFVICAFFCMFNLYKPVTAKVLNFLSKDHCINCGRFDLFADYCPRCGQFYNRKEIKWTRCGCGDLNYPSNIYCGDCGKKLK